MPKNEGGYTNVVFAGRTSVGKSSLLDEFFGPKPLLKTSKGTCTK